MPFTVLQCVNKDIIIILTMGNTVLDSIRLDSTINEHGICK